MRELLREDMRWALRRTPRPVLQLLKEKPAQAFVGGGFLRACVAGEKASDVDIFAPSATAAREFAVFLQSKAQGARLHETQNAFTIRGGDLPLPLQVIHRWVYDSPEQLMKSFDFTIAMAGFWWEASPTVHRPDMDFVSTDENLAPLGSTVRVEIPAGPAIGWRSICHDRFYEDLAAKRLRYTAPVRNEDAGGSLLRVLKFYQRGYRIPLDSLGAVVARLLNDVRMQAVMNGHEATRERHLAKVLTGLLREVDPNIDPSHIAHLPSEEDERGMENEEELNGDTQTEARA